MLAFKNRNVVSLGEAMIEMAPVDGGLYARGFAGDTFNTAWHMKQLLGEQANIAFFTRIGQDRLSSAFASELAADGLDISHVGRDPERNMGLYLIELDGVERSFHYWRGQSAARRLADDKTRLTSALQDAGLIYLSGITLAILSAEARGNLFEALADARANGSIISFDPNIRPRLWTSPEEIRTTVAAMLAITDIALPSFDDEKMHWNDASPQETIQRLFASGVGEVVVKNGASLVHFRANGKDGSRCTPPAKRIRDTTGAGDAFNSGYLSARLMGYPPEQSVTIAQRLAAEVIRHFGARAPKHKLAALAGLIQA